MDESRLVDLREALLNADMSGEAVLTVAEFKEASNSVELDDVIESLEVMDSLTKISIDCDSFLYTVVRLRSSAEDYCLWSPFQSFDRDGDGAILKTELIKSLQDFDISSQLDGLGDSWKKAATMAADLVREVEEDGDARIDYQEFRNQLHIGG